MTEPVYKGIRDVSNIVGVGIHTLRFWEKKFPYLNPKKIDGHNRLYTSDDIAYLQRIHHYLKNEGYTTQGVLRLIKIHGIKAFRQGNLDISKDMTKTTHTLVKDVENILARLQKLRNMTNE